MEFFICSHTFYAHKVIAVRLVLVFLCLFGRVVQVVLAVMRHLSWVMPDMQVRGGMRIHVHHLSTSVNRNS